MPENKKKTNQLQKRVMMFPMDKLLVYSEMLDRMQQNIDEVGTKATMLEKLGLMDEAQKKKIHDKLIKKAEIVEKRRGYINDELGTRFKKDMAIQFTVQDIFDFAQELKKDNEHMNLSYDELSQAYMHKLQQDRNLEKEKEVANMEVVTDEEE